ncbi:GHKL domain-containing protein [bacterium]|nr:GHKL domain-containing protein [bacterium]
MKFLELYIGGIILWTVFYLIGRILFEETEKPNYIKLVPIIMLFSYILAHINYVNSEILNGIIKIICVYSLYCTFYKIIFKKELSKVLVASLILYLCLCASEVVIAIIASIVLATFHESLAFLKNTILINTIISLTEILIISLSKQKLIPYVKNSKLNRKSSLIIILVLLVTLALLIFKIPINKWKFNTEFIITMLILLFFCIIGLIIVKQNSDIQKTTSMYQKLVDYSDITNGLLEDYRVVSHEQKNQLLVIRSMLDDNSPKELVEYVDGLLDKKVGFKYEWIGELNHLPLSGLKGLINYKLIEAHTIDININISISKDVNNSNLNRMSTTQKDELYSIMGVYLDNAIQAAKESNKKEVSLEIYKENEKIVIIIANTYNGKIEMEKLDNYGYTTKGKNHGVGLHLVKKIIENEVIYSQLRSLFEDYYVQKLIIDLSGIK